MPITPFSTLASQHPEEDMLGVYGSGREAAAHCALDANGFQTETRVEHSSGSLEWRSRDRICRWAREGSLQNGGLDVVGFADALGSVDAPGLKSGLGGAASDELPPGDADGFPRAGGSAGDLVGAAADSTGVAQLEVGPVAEEAGAAGQEVRLVCCMQGCGSNTWISTSG